jgi:hypothetical protein
VRYMVVGDDSGPNSLQIKMAESLGFSFVHNRCQAAARYAHLAYLSSAPDRTPRLGLREIVRILCESLPHGVSDEA